MELQALVTQSVAAAKHFQGRGSARSLPGTRGGLSVDINLDTSLGKVQDTIKVYSAVTDKYSALFVLIKMGEEATADYIVNVYGSFDPARMGGSVNLFAAAGPGSGPASGSGPAPGSGPALGPGPSAQVNMQMTQMSAFKGDAAGAAFFANMQGPPPCAAYNYCVVTMGGLGQDGTFVIKPSGWKQGEAAAYSFNLSELTPLSMLDMGNAEMWCKPPKAASASAPTAAPTAAAAAAAEDVAPKRPAKAINPAVVGGAVAAVLVILGLVMASRRK